MRQGHTPVLEAFKGLPMGRDNSLLVEHVAQVRPYAEWRQFLRQRRDSATA